MAETNRKLMLKVICGTDVLSASTNINVGGDGLLTIERNKFLHFFEVF
jgi:hypothetical protein